VQGIEVHLKKNWRNEERTMQKSNRNENRGEQTPSRVEGSEQTQQRRRRAVGCFLQVLALQLLLFGLLAWFVHVHPILPLDIAITHSFQENQAPWLRIAMLAISYPGSSLLLPVLILLAALSQGWVVALIVALFMVLLLGIVMGEILAPRIFSSTVGVHPIVAIFALFAGAELFGLLGGFFAIPVACSSRSSWLSGTGGNMSIPNSSRRKKCLFNHLGHCPDNRLLLRKHPPPVQDPEVELEAACRIV
jgi:hypothetical protein